MPRDQKEILPPSALRPDKYRIIRELGRGGMGVVFLAEDKLLQRTVALKVLYDHLTHDAVFVTRFQKEAQAVSSFHHPNIVFVHGLEPAGDRFLIDMEYVDGLSLDHFTQSTPVAPPVAARIAGDILEGLTICHGAGIVHRDIKPANILLTREGLSKIADFGLATACATQLVDSMKVSAASGLFLGTPRYAPPAAWEGSEPIPAWDLYSLGVMLHEMLTGRVAYPGDSPMAIMRQQLVSPLVPVSQAVPAVSAQFASLVDMLVGGEGKEGTANSTQEVLQALRETPEFQAANEGETAATMRVALRKSHNRDRPRSRRNKWLAAATACTLLLIAAGMAWRMPEGEALAAPPLAPEARLPRLSDPLVFLRPFPVNATGFENALWMISTPGENARREVIALNEMGLWAMYLEPGPVQGRFTVDGHWGEYLTPAAGSLRFGTLHGEALLDAAGNGLSLSLNLVNARDQTEMPLFLLATPLETPLDRAKFLENLESNYAVQSLLHNELLPRNLPWARQVEALMPSFVPGRLEVPRRAEAARLDGLLTEPVWSASPAEAAGDAALPQIPLLAFWSPEALMLGFSAEDVPAGFRLEIVLARGPWIASGASPHYFVQVDQNGHLHGEAKQGSTVLPWTCDWEGATALQDGRWQAEIRIPLSENAAPALPQQEQRWRLNACLRDAAGTPLKTWGYPETQAVEHGLILSFKGDE